MPQSLGLEVPACRFFSAALEDQGSYKVLLAARIDVNYPRGQGASIHGKTATKNPDYDAIALPLSFAGLQIDFLEDDGILAADSSTIGSCH